MNINELLLFFQGIFVLDPPDGQTYNCGKFPKAWNVTLENMFTTAIPEQAVEALNLLMQATYNTSEYQMSNCEFGSLSQLVCGRENPW